MLSLLARSSRLGLRSLSRKTTIHQYEYQLVRSFSNSKIFREEKNATSEKPTWAIPWAQRMDEEVMRTVIETAEASAKKDAETYIIDILPRIKIEADKDSLTKDIIPNEGHIRRARLLFHAHEHKIVGDVIDNVRVNPTIDFIVQYPGVFVEGGNVLTLSQVSNEPNVTLDNIDPTNYYSILLVDPDTPTRSKPTTGEYLQWFVANIPGSTPTTSKGETIVEYVGALPPEKSGKHRYAFLLFEHGQKINFSEPKIGKTSSGRSGFKTRNFISKYNINSPVSVTFFISEYDASYAKIKSTMN